MTEQPPATTATNQLQTAEQLMAQKKYAEALDILRPYWLENPANIDAIRLFSRLMKALGKKELSGSIYKLAESQEAIDEDVQNLFEAGFKLIDERELQLAVMLLSRCAMKMPNHALVTYELGFALMALGQFAEAQPYFENAFKSGRDFDTALNLCVCYTLMRKIDTAKEMIDVMSQFAKEEDEQKEIAHRGVVLKRLAQFAKKSQLTPQDWLYILYGTLLLGEPPATVSTSVVPDNTFGSGSSGARKSLVPDYKAVAWTLIVLEKVLSELEFEFDVVEFYSPISRPLAEAMAHIMNLPAKSFGGTISKDRALMLMAWAPNIIGPHKSFNENSRFRVLFSYGLTSVQSLPLTPDVVGAVCSDCQMPWAQTSEEEAESKTNPGRFDFPDSYQVKATDRILEQVSELESRPEIIQAVEEIASYYKPKREWLVLGNTNFKERPEYTAEIVV